jgi:hypothetical protein
VHVLSPGRRRGRVEPRGRRRRRLSFPCL